MKIAVNVHRKSAVRSSIYHRDQLPLSLASLGCIPRFPTQIAYQLTTYTTLVYCMVLGRLRWMVVVLVFLTLSLLVLPLVLPPLPPPPLLFLLVPVLIMSLLLLLALSTRAKYPTIVHLSLWSTGSLSFHFPSLIPIFENPKALRSRAILLYMCTWNDELNVSWVTFL